MSGHLRAKSAKLNGYRKQALTPLCARSIQGKVLMSNILPWFDHVPPRIKIKATANPYAPEDARYFWNRRHNRNARLMKELSARAMRTATA